MAISSTLQKLDQSSPSGCFATGLHREIITGVGTTRTLKQEESGSLCILDQAATQTWTLPAPVAGAQFELFWGIKCTGTHKIVTNATTVFLVGAIMVGDGTTVGDSGDVFEANGTTIRAFATDGDTKGGFIGSRLKLTAISTTQWAITGLMIGVGSPTVTGFATS